MKRKAINKKDRYEIFKRDSFTCQYCGRKAPDVVLEIDHIKPVSKGGTNDIFNLITSCFDCNRGKENKTPQWKQDLFYIRGIARNRYGYINEWKLIEMLEEAHIIHEYSIDDLKDMVFECKNWTQLKNTLEGIMYDS